MKTIKTVIDKKKESQKIIKDKKNEILDLEKKIVQERAFLQRAILDHLHAYIKITGEEVQGFEFKYSELKQDEHGEPTVNLFFLIGMKTWYEP